MKSFECSVDQAKLRGTTGVMKTEGLFLEMANKINSHENRRLPAVPVYTLKDYEHKGYPSMYKIYIASDTEYEAAIKLLGSWRHWKKLCRSKFFHPYIDEWREERRLLEEALARTALLRSLEDNNISAARTILEGSKRKGAGRPTNNEVAGNMKQAVEDMQDLDNIVQRMSSV